jgi:hypothetical protein
MDPPRRGHGQGPQHRGRNHRCHRSHRLPRGLLPGGRRAHRPERVGAYAVGVGLGTLLGLAVDRRLNPRHAQVDVVAPGPANELLDALHERGWPTTSSMGYGLSGNVVIASVTVDEHRLHPLLDDLRQIAPDAFWTVRTVRTAKAVPLPAAFLQIGRRTQVPGGQPPPAAPRRNVQPSETASTPGCQTPVTYRSLRRSTARRGVLSSGNHPKNASRLPDGPRDNGPYRARHNDALRPVVEAAIARGSRSTTRAHTRRSALGAPYRTTRPNDGSARVTTCIDRRICLRLATGPTRPDRPLWRPGRARWPGAARPGLCS